MTPGESEATGNGAGEWIDVDPLPGAFIVNIGRDARGPPAADICGATEHRVAACRRVSASRLPYFFKPSTRTPPCRCSSWPDDLAVHARGVSVDPANERIFLDLRPECVEEQAASSS